MNSLVPFETRRALIRDSDGKEIEHTTVTVYRPEKIGEAEYVGVERGVLVYLKKGAG